MTARARRFPLFDSLRAIAALAVVLYHALAAGTILRALHVSGLQRYADHLDVGVTIFFLISGFLLYRPFARARLEGERLPAVGAYAWRRFLRIVPAYWVALVLIALWLSLGGVLAAGGWRYFGFAQIYRGSSALGGIPQAWTLCVEATFYAFLPIWALLIRALPARDPRRWLVTEAGGLALLVAASIAYKAWAASQIDVASPAAAPYLMPLPNFLDDFAIGMGLAVASVAVEAGLVRGGALGWLRRHASVAWLAALAAFVVAGRAIGPSSFAGAASARGELLSRHALYTLVALGVVLPAVSVRAPRGVAQRVLALRPLLWIGLVSYSLYLWHFAVQIKLARLFGAPSGAAGALALLAAMIAAPVAVAAVSYYAVERPALRLRGLVGGRRGAAAAEQPGAASVPASPTGR